MYGGSLVLFGCWLVEDRSECELAVICKIEAAHLKENATVFPYSNMFFPQLRRVDMYLSRLSPCT